MIPISGDVVVQTVYAFPNRRAFAFLHDYWICRYSVDRNGEYLDGILLAGLDRLTDFPVCPQSNNSENRSTGNDPVVQCTNRKDSADNGEGFAVEKQGP